MVRVAPIFRDRAHALFRRGGSGAETVQEIGTLLDGSNRESSETWAVRSPHCEGGRAATGRNLRGRRLAGSDREGLEDLGAQVAIHECGCPERLRGGRPWDRAVHARCVRRYFRRIRATAADEVEAAWDGIAAVAIELERSRLLVGTDIDRVLSATIGLPTGSGRSIDRSGPATG